MEAAVRSTDPDRWERYLRKQRQAEAAAEREREPEPPSGSGSEVSDSSGHLPMVRRLQGPQYMSSLQHQSQQPQDQPQQAQHQPQHQPPVQPPEPPLSCTSTSSTLISTRQPPVPPEQNDEYILMTAQPISLSMVPHHLCPLECPPTPSPTLRMVL